MTKYNVNLHKASFVARACRTYVLQAAKIDK